MPSLERHGHLKLDEAIRAKVLAMSAATIDRLLRVARQATRGKKQRRVVPEIRRRVRVRTFADWHEPPPGCIDIGRLQYRQSSKSRTRRRPDPLEANWAEMLHCLEADPDQTSQELLAAFKFRLPCGAPTYRSTPTQGLAT